MKVCTDATLFAAMTPISGTEKVLDIGSGTGVLSLIVAQLGAAHVTAVELTKAAHKEACVNFKNSPWSKNITPVEEDIRCYAEHIDKQFDLIICNPPFFQKHSKTSDPLRQLARHTDELPYTDLLKSVAKLLTDDGLFYLLIPAPMVEQVVHMAAQQHHLFNIKRTDFRGYTRNQAKVSALLFSHTAQPLVYSTLTIYQADRIYSKESEQYLAPFLLRFKKPLE